MASNLVLVDTSAWVENFRRQSSFRLEQEVDFDDVVVCLPVVQEVLQGFKDQSAYRFARESMMALPIVESPMSLPLFEEAIDLYRRARRAGLTIRSSVDCLIAACALRHSLTILHRDRDYEALAKVSSLSVRKIEPA